MSYLPLLIGLNFFMAGFFTGMWLTIRLKRKQREREAKP